MTFRWQVEGRRRGLVRFRWCVNDAPQLEPSWTRGWAFTVYGALAKLNALYRLELRSREPTLPDLLGGDEADLRRELERRAAQP